MFASKAALRDSWGPSECLIWNFGWFTTGSDICGSCGRWLVSIIGDTDVDAFGNVGIDGICGGRDEDEEVDMLVNG
jgi:hypothetical protein